MADARENASFPGSGAVSVPRPWAVRRLLDIDASGTLTGIHVRIIAEAAGVSERTMWRWLREAREGRLEARPRKNGFTLSDALWAELARLGGNVVGLRRSMLERQAAGTLAAWDAASVPSASTLHRAVRDDVRAGRLLEVAPGSRTGTPPSDYDRALADLRLDELFTEPASPAPEEAGLDDHSPVVSRARLYTPDARLVVTTQVAAVVEAVGHVAAARGVLCVFGDAGRGKTVAVERALKLLPSRVPVWRAAAPVQATLPHLRAALVAALDVSSVAPTHRAQACDRGLIEALQQPGVFFLDDAQRLPPPLLDYLRLLWDAPTTIATLILCGAGCERVLAQAPALASRVLTWHEVARLDPTRLPYTLPLFHHIWHTAAPDDVRHVDDTVAKGNFRTWAKITSHLHATLVRRPDTVAGRELLKQACARLGPHP